MKRKSRRPATGSSGRGPSFSVTGKRRQKNSPNKPDNQFRITFRIEPGGPPIMVKGRVAQTLDLLLTTGPRGFTSGEASPLGWARRTSHYVFELRALGVVILTVWETAGDCRIGRYVLQSRITVVNGSTEAA